LDKRKRCELAHIAVAQLRVLLLVGHELSSTEGHAMQRSFSSPTRTHEMKNLATAIAVLCLSSSVLAHDRYTDLRDWDRHLCCNEQDCRPVEATVLPNGNYYLSKTDEVVPADMASSSPDDRFHRCNDRVTHGFDPRGYPLLGSKPFDTGVIVLPPVF